MENYYEYLHEETIEKTLICNVCHKPFLQPVTIPNGNIRCYQCVEQTIDKNELILLTDVSVLDALDKIRVKCALCDEENIERGDFENHMIKQCSKAIVSCPGCDWIGLREELPIHLDVCSSESLTKNRSIEDLIGKFIPISNINFHQRNFHNQDIAIAVKALLINKRSRYLDLFNKGISSKGALIIASVLHNDTCLEILSLRNNLICDSGVQYLAHALVTNSTLQRLDLNGNSITDIGVRLLTEMLKTNETLIKLTLSFNRITNEGLDLLIDVIMNYNSTLQWLSLTGNSGINDSSMHSILHFIRHNQSLKTLNLEDCNLSPWHKKQIHIYQKIYFKTKFDVLL
jgi:hypothetical protein